jgi:hypothetical protein
MRRSVWAFVRSIAPALSWVYVAFAVYFLIGATLFPGWWKRFIFDAGILDGRFWIAAWQHLYAMLKGRLPLGLVLGAILVSVPAYLLFMAGRIGPRQLLSGVKAVPRSLFLGATAVILLTLLGLATVKADYQTPDEIHAAFEEARERLQTDNFRSLFRPSPPKSGFFIYLDALKLARAYNTLQKELTLVLQTETQENASEQKVGANLKSVSGEAIARTSIEKSIQQAPTVATPERQAQWLIQTYNELNMVVDLPLFFGGKDYRSYELQEALEELQKRGVTLSPQQQASAIDGDVALLENKLNRPNVPLLFEGEMTIESGGEHFKIMFETGGGAHVIAQGSGSLASLDDGLHGCSRQSGGCVFKGNILAIVWRSSRQDTSIRLDLIPLALW